ncbi:MAG: type IV toxin-antitoxin system AbiEi family antitoxin domain-containing protein [Thermodesulfobacteriota bacterium]
MIQQRKLRFDAARSDIISFFRQSPDRVLSYTDLQNILKDNREFWRLTQSTTVEDLIEFLSTKGRMQRVEVQFPKRKMVRFTWGEVPAFEVILSWHPDSYLSHYTAVYLHDLTEQMPKTVYLNVEQPRKGGRVSTLSQEGINSAFRRPMRRSKTVARFREFEICLLGSMGTANLGVVEAPGPEGETIRLTNVERTLIDITVRPGYAGGVHEVLKAFRSAKGKVSVNRLTAMLKKLDYIYPYHQAMGFYLDRAGVYDESQVRLLRKLEMKYDFYLAHDIKELDYSPEWRLFFPKGL